MTNLCMHYSILIKIEKSKNETQSSGNQRQNEKPGHPFQRAKQYEEYHCRISLRAAVEYPSCLDT